MFDIESPWSSQRCGASFLLAEVERGPVPSKDIQRVKPCQVISRAGVQHFIVRLVQGMAMGRRIGSCCVGVC